MSAFSKTCVPFPNIRIFAGARRIGRGEFKGFYRGYVTASEMNGCGKITSNTFVSAIVRPTRKGAVTDAIAAAEHAVKTGYVPEF